MKNKFSEKQIQIILFLQYMDESKWVIAERIFPVYHATYIRSNTGLPYPENLLSEYDPSEISILVDKKILIETTIATPAINTKYYKLIPVTANVHNTLRIMTSGHKLIK